jgi:hypothetical protein
MNLLTLYWWKMPLGRPVMVQRRLTLVMEDARGTFWISWSAMFLISVGRMLAFLKSEPIQGIQGIQS